MIRDAATELLPHATLAQDLKWVRAAAALLPPALNPRAALESDRAQSLITLVSLVILCASCHWEQHDDGMTDPLDNIIEAARLLGLSPARLRELMGWASTTSRVDRELPFLVHDRAGRLCRVIVPILRRTFASDADMARWFLKFLFMRRHEDEELDDYVGCIELWCKAGCTVYA